jgi:hypothetical protein
MDNVGVQLEFAEPVAEVANEAAANDPTAIDPDATPS